MLSADDVRKNWGEGEIARFVDGPRTRETEGLTFSVDGLRVRAARVRLSADGVP